MLLVTMAPGGFIVFGLILGIINTVTERVSKRKGAQAS
jgi:Na+-translocating ferredoxin:NAD+ oxidoreductase RnfE subunit